MNLTVIPFNLQLHHPFRIARSSALHIRHDVFFRLEHDGIRAWGEASPSAFYGETQKSVAEALRGIGDDISDPFAIENTLLDLKAKKTLKAASLAAVDMTLYDYVGKKLNAPVWRMLGLTPKPIVSSFTLGISTPEETLEKLEEAKACPILKIKVGMDGDVELVRKIRERTDAIIRVDANTSWTVEEAPDKTRAMADMGIELIEQPFPPGQFDDTARLTEISPVPIIADEDAKTLADIPNLVGVYHGINIKLAKCGGIREAIRMIHAARAHDMKVMIGCMIESSLSLSAAAQITPLVDFADLDGGLLIDHDPFEGAIGDDCAIRLSDRPGLGVVATRWAEELGLARDQET